MRHSLQNKAALQILEEGGDISELTPTARALVEKYQQLLLGNQYYLYIVREEDGDLLEYLQAHDRFDIDRFIEAIVSLGKIDLFETYSNIEGVEDRAVFLLTLAIENGQLEMLKYLIKEKKILPSDEELDEAFRLGNLEIIKYLHEIHYSTWDPVENYETVMRLARENRRDIIDYILFSMDYIHIYPEIFELLLQGATEGKHLELFIYLAELMPDDFEWTSGFELGNMLDLALRNGSYALAKYIIKMNNGDEDGGYAYILGYIEMTHPQELQGFIQELNREEIEKTLPQTEGKIRELLEIRLGQF